MLIVGAGGLAKEVLQIFHDNNALEGLCFYDDVNTYSSDMLYNQFHILKNMEAVVQLFKTDNRFIIAVGKPSLRKELHQKFAAVGGQPVTAISPYAFVGNYGTHIGDGTIVMAGTVITNDVFIGKSCLVNPNCTISHDSRIDDFVELSPNVNITGKCIVEKAATIGTGSIILPGLTIGETAIVGAGAVVIEDVSASSTVIGIPAKPLKKSINE